MPEEQGACYKTGPSAEKVVLGDFREEVVSRERPACGKEPREAECTIRAEGMKGAVNEAGLRGYWFGSVSYNAGLPRSVGPWGLCSP